MRYFIAAVLMIGVFFGFMSIPAAYAVEPTPEPTSGIWGPCVEGEASAVCEDTSDAQDVVKRVINLLLYVIGILSVIMIVHSGLKYTTSRGDAEQIKSAKNTLLYAVIGLIVAMLAFAIVNFVVEAFKPAPATSSLNRGRVALNEGVLL